MKTSHERRSRAQLRRALNIAEGAGEFSVADKQRFYRMARRSATESAAVLDIIKRRGHAPREMLELARDLLLRIVSMLIRMTHSDTSGTGTGTPASRAGTGAGR